MESHCTWKKKIDTILAQAGNRQDNVTGAISMPLYFSTAYRHHGLGESTGYDYSRMNQPTRQVLEEVLAKLENGVRAFGLSSGMAAIQLVFTQFKSGNHIVVSDDLYGGSFRFFDLLSQQYGIEFSQWNGQDFDQLAQLLTEKTKAVWIETPSNPMMKVIDIKKTAELTHQNQAQLIVDNTFYTPLIQQVLDEGADIAVHSATKYLSGHNDILAGAVICKDEQTAEVLDKNLITIGSNISPFDSWLLLRSLKTLPIRLKKQQENAQQLVSLFKQSKAVTNVLYPGKGGMISLYTAKNIKIDTFLKKLEVVSFAESLGGTETLVTVPAVQTHADLSEQQRQKTGITDNLLRISCGLEDSDDLIKDFKQAFKQAESEE
ncbi:aminotransferase class I/II-fold pyridoxal phosphate-dependent enzyme [Holzapfeliella floricola]|uniref:Cystathionine gamma-synthase n=1 Tax=Holzapfeliella floricola DSM 23037 = JCM 16512 TaxID=1423744 RepID=A0A0R2DV32_9LACO|nr:aminotransferase class I/II-fold pyridoxal phosphate-dependent enzyme [Holzapfeliella floricola]KRN04839.1 cystathionine gamma-synthase [Holzapfeliella floricola DSM 23037 = JCM 16512]